MEIYYLPDKDRSQHHRPDDSYGSDHSEYSGLCQVSGCSALGSHPEHQHLLNHNGHAPGNRFHHGHNPALTLPLGYWTRVERVMDCGRHGDQYGTGADLSA